MQTKPAFPALSALLVFLSGGLFALLPACDGGGAPGDQPVGLARPPDEGGNEESVIECGGEDKVEGVSITGRLDYIDSANAGSYVLKGRCDQKNRTVEITVNDFPLDEEVVCKNKRWEVTLNLAPLFAGADSSGKARFKARQSRSGPAACREVRSAFTCPAGYLPVPELKGYAKSFCVMKYEAKLPDKDDAKAVSVPEGLPLDNVSYNTAERLCRNIGIRYDLMSNEQWQTIARHIEAVDENWFSGRRSRTPGNYINCGVNRGASKPASANDADDCTRRSSCKKNEPFSYFKRTHFLPGDNNIIWDFCGNVGEIMKDSNSKKYSFNDQVSLLKGDAKKRFGPDKEYSKESADSGSRRRLRQGRYWGLGEARLKQGGSLIVRGGQSAHAGIFSVHLDKDQGDSYHRNTGFRCVYNP